jgi:hypothetical protein
VPTAAIRHALRALASETGPQATLRGVKRMRVCGGLSQDPTVRVALLEAGGQDDAPEIGMPLVSQLFTT